MLASLNQSTDELAPAKARRSLVEQALARGKAVDRRSDAPAWAILQVRMAQAQQLRRKAEKRVA
jgi:hypothetical protein